MLCGLGRPTRAFTAFMAARWIIFAVRMVFPAIPCNRFYEDREGNLWVATTKGIDCFRDVRVATFSTREGLATPEVDSVLAARDGTVWIGGA